MSCNARAVAKNFFFGWNANAVIFRTCRTYFREFRHVNFILEITPRFKRHSQILYKDHGNALEKIPTKSIKIRPIVSAIGMDSNIEHTVIVTGFGPFEHHAVNASWEAVKELSQLCSNSKEFRDIRVVIKEIPVSYEYVAEEIPKLWKEFNPIVVLHIGVSHKAKCLTLEHYAHGNGYKRKDIYDRCPKEVNISPDVLETVIDVNKICKIVNENLTKTGCKACVSDNAGIDK
ncbi:hypothetical protein KM043_004634 [Ampulex compressa]|nr:hypothetical protein KM043_004634 [Ampulex compressa]